MQNGGYGRVGLGKRLSRSVIMLSPPGGTTGYFPADSHAGSRAARVRVLALRVGG